MGKSPILAMGVLACMSVLMIANEKVYGFGLEVALRRRLISENVISVVQRCYIKNASFLQTSSMLPILQIAASNDNNETGGDKNEGDKVNDSSLTDSDFSSLFARVNKMRLEEEHVRRMLRSKPRFLPYKDCSGWVQAWGRRWESKEEWRDWIDMGEKRNSYIPSRPDEYYGKQGTWISWDDFLFGENMKEARTEQEEEE